VPFPFEQAFITPGGKIIGEIKERTRTTLDVIKENPTATIPALAELTGKSQRTISRELREYQDGGLLRPDGERRNGRWAVE
jgi:predicted HTH transcriptional regulator